MTTPPQVRQCTDPADPQFGAVAVTAAVPGWAWGVFNPVNGGHWETNDSIVGAWTLMTPATLKGQEPGQFKPDPYPEPNPFPRILPDPYPEHS